MSQERIYNMFEMVVRDQNQRFWDPPYVDPPPVMVKMVGVRIDTGFIL